MSFGDPRMRGAARSLLWLWLLCPLCPLGPIVMGCARPTEVELRLFPCGLVGGLPVLVDLDVQGYDAAGMSLAPLRKSFPVVGSVLGDGYATVGLRRPPEIATADFTVTWHDATGDAQTVMHPALMVPEVGEVLELGAEMCAPVGSTSSGGSSSSSGEGTSSSTSTSSASSSTSTGDSTSSSSGEGTSTSTSTSTGETTGTGTTGEPSMVGDPCNTGPDQYFCENGGAGQLGTLLECVSDVWTAANLQLLCKTDVYCPLELGQVDPVPVGCSGLGSIGWACVCQDKVPLPCVGDEAACLGDDKITLCIEDEMGTQIRTKGMCAPSCLDDDFAGPLCVG